MKDLFKNIAMVLVFEVVFVYDTIQVYILRKNLHIWVNPP